MKTLKFLVVLLLTFSFIIKPSQLAKSTCGGYDGDAYKAYSFFEPISFEQLASLEWKYDRGEEDNIQAWKGYFQNRFSNLDLKKIIYETSLEDLEQVRNYISKNSSGLDESLKNNPLINHWRQRNALPALDYLIFAKRCEPQAQYYSRWDDFQRDPEAMRQLLTEGKKAAESLNDNTFLKLRYAYQAIRMAQYSGENTQAIQLYFKLVNPHISEPENTPVIAYWALSHAAGAMQASGDYSESSYLFSRVFEQCPSRRVSSYLSFEVKSQDDWSGMLDLCKNEEEEANLYFIRALDKNSHVLEEMKAIYSVAPASEKLSMLLLREVNKLEYNLLNVNLSQNLLFLKSYQSFPRQESIEQLLALKGFISQVIREEKVTQPNLWRLADGYLSYVAGNPQRAENIFQALKKDTRDKKFKDQIELFEIAMQISRLRKLDDESEDRIYKLVQSKNHEELFDFMLRAFGRLYKKQNQLAKSFLTKGYIGELKYEPRVELIDDLIVLAKKRKPTVFESEYLFPRIKTQSYLNNPDIKAEHILLEIKGTILFSQDRLKEAVETYQQIPSKLLYVLEDDPFQVNIVDCLECPPSPDKGKYNRLTLAVKMLELKSYIKQMTLDQARYYFELGTAYYNLTHFGNSWMAIDYFRSGMDLWNYKRVQAENKPTEDLNVYMDVSKPKYYFDRAMNAALRNGDSELAAISCYMAAKCELKQYYLDPLTEPSWDYIDPPSSDNTTYRRYFRQLKNEFQNTQYYKKVVEECKYFHEFVQD